MLDATAATAAVEEKYVLEDQVEVDVLDAAAAARPVAVAVLHAEAARQVLVAAAAAAAVEQQYAVMEIDAAVLEVDVRHLPEAERTKRMQALGRIERTLFRGDEPVSGDGTSRWEPDEVYENFKERLMKQAIHALEDDVEYCRESAAGLLCR